MQYARCHAALARTILADIRGRCQRDAAAHSVAGRTRLSAAGDGQCEVRRGRADYDDGDNGDDGEWSVNCETNEA